MSLPSTIVIPLDGTSTSARSLPPACAVADAAGADVSIVSVVVAPFASSVTDKLRGQATDAGLVEPHITLDVSSMSPGERLLAILEDDDDALLCLATRARAHLGQMLGSVPETLVRARRGPFLLVGPSCGPDTHISGGPVVVPVDGSDVADEVLPLAAVWADALGVVVELVQVRPDGPIGPAERLDASALLQPRARRIDTHRTQPRPTRWATLTGDAGSAIAEHAAALGASMVVMATHGRTGLPRVLMGSVAIAVVAAAPCPVLMHRPLRLRTL